jgi:ABC-type bacteriocin/lantibiotic exporter with double-glycine peptidase domain
MMLMLGVLMLFMSWAQVTLWAIFAQRIAYKTRLVYFARTLEMDAAFYDENNPNEMSAKIAKEISAIQRGLGEKVGNTIMSVAMFVFGFGLAFYFGWKFSLILLGVFPFLMVTGVGMAMSLESGVTQMMRAYA